MKSRHLSFDERFFSDKERGFLVIRKKERGNRNEKTIYIGISN